MPKCRECSKKFDVSDAQRYYNSEFDGEFDYDEDFGGEYCGYCAADITGSNLSRGEEELELSGYESD